MVINYRITENNDKYKKVNILRKSLEKKGHKVSVVLFDMTPTVDLDDLCKDCDKFIFLNLKGSDDYIGKHISKNIEKLINKNIDIIMVGYVPNRLKKYVDEEIDMDGFFKKLNERKYVKTFESFHLDQPKTMSELLEKLSVVEQNILDSVKAELINIDAFFNEEVSKNDLDHLVDNGEFQKLLRIKGLVKSPIEHTDDYETFLLNPFKYVLIRDKNKTNLQDPDFIIIQTFNSTEQDWNNLKMYKINGDFSNFYNKLSSRSIEINHDGVNYIYQTSNRNEWELVNQKETDRFPRFIRKEELLNIINK